MTHDFKPIPATMTQTHTPGPWHRNVPPASKYPTIWAGRNKHVARVIEPGSMVEGECEANLNLIAAAPELLAALRDAEFLLRKVGINWREAASMADSMKRSAADAATAIAKAEGRS